LSSSRDKIAFCFRGGARKKKFFSPAPTSKFIGILGFHKIIEPFIKEFRLSKIGNYLHGRLHVVVVVVVEYCKNAPKWPQNRP
jgi:hypothetical protein